MASAVATTGGNAPKAFANNDKGIQVRLSNISAGKALADLIRTSLGPRGMDKMIEKDAQVTISNDGATILKEMGVGHPAGRMLVNLSSAQDTSAGDGTTSVVVLAGSFLTAAEKLLNQGVHPSLIADSFTKASAKAVDVLQDFAIPVSLAERSQLLKAVSTSLSSKIVAPYSSLLSPIAVDAVLRLAKEGKDAAAGGKGAKAAPASGKGDPSSPASADTIDLRDIRIVKRPGGTIEDCELSDGVLLNQLVTKSAGGVTRVEKARIALVQFQLSHPKTDLDNSIVVTDYRQMDRLLKEERLYILNLCKRIKKAGANVVLVQKSILREGVSELALAYLQKLGIMVINNVERDEMDFLSRALGCVPISDIEQFTSDKLGEAELVEETSKKEARYVQVRGVKRPFGKTSSVLVMGNNSLVLEEVDRSLHDALCVMRCLVKKSFLVTGGGTPEIHVSLALARHALTLPSIESVCFSAFAAALEVIPYTLAENAGLNPIQIVTELRNRHASGDTTAGINVRKGSISNILDENVIQPLLVSTSAIELATETVALLLRIDDFLVAR